MIGMALPRGLASPALPYIGPGGSVNTASSEKGDHTEDRKDGGIRALLVDIDSKLPNLALMQLSSFIKGMGGAASFTENDPTHAFVSCIFTRNRHKALSSKAMLERQYPGIDVDVGGTGVDISHAHLGHRQLEFLMPDYSLYPKMDYSMGFTSRGCNRRCHFCFVPEKEGRFSIAHHPLEFHNPEFNKIVLMDNNILWNKDWFFTVTDWILETGLRVDFNQGLDIRLLDEDVVRRIRELRPVKLWRFAFDSMDYADAVKDGLSMLKAAGINLRNACQFYVYLDGDGDFDDALGRCNILREHNTQAYLMINGDLKGRERTERMKDLARWCRPWIFWGVPFNAYKRRGGGGFVIVETVHCRLTVVFAVTSEHVIAVAAVHVRGGGEDGSD